MNCFRYNADYERVLGLSGPPPCWRSQLAPLNVAEQCFFSKLLPILQGSALPSCGGKPFQPLVSEISRPKAHDHRQVLERRRTRKSRAQVELLRRRQYLLCNLERADTLSLVWSHILGFGGAHAHPFSLGCEPCTVHVAGPEGTNKTTSSAKSRGEILWAPNQYPCRPPS